ncbi:DUF2496 domain-containing protein [Vibrio sagamiensis]|uniref:Primosomal protein n=1 Tax=Vibrio sagamiensis NBRC 104589 TaxID=1219064 RepID=A0A511QC78_9VIBR|nr:DUF2496 domain-containing protein [Vibrio sagamiensis]PNQ67738.1 DUF2496 domain-containing protein [Vibrio agarivorans]GEM74900.1 primosomal protein [Vibrio sagamiensis NBRC 104589]
MSDQPSLENAAKETQLAVDIIYLLEVNNIDPAQALKALKIVQSDLEYKLSQE